MKHKTLWHAALALVAAGLAALGGAGPLWP